MSILQEYEEIREYMGMGKVKAIHDYIKEQSDKGNDILYSDIIYKRKCYDEFEKWFLEKIEPFVIHKHTDESYSLTLDEKYFDRELFISRNSDGIYGNGYDYESLIRNYIDKKSDLSEYNYNFDSEAGMFCVFSDSIKKLEYLAYSFSNEIKNNFNYIEDLVRDMKDYNYYL